MKNGIIILMVLISACSALKVQSQESEADSLLQLFDNAQHDTTRIQLLLKIGKAYRFKIPDTALKYFNKALDLSNKNLEVLKIPSNKEKKVSTSYYNNLLSLKAKSLRSIGDIHYHLGNPDKTMNSLLEALDISTKIGDKKGISACYNNMGAFLADLGNYDESMEKFSMALEINEELEDTLEMSKCYSNMGIVHLYMGKYDNALENYLKAFKLFKKLGNKRGIAIAYSNIAMIHEYHGNYDKAMENYLESLIYFEELEDKGGVSGCYANIGNVYHGQNNYEMAIEYYNNALKINEELGDKDGISACSNNLGTIYENQGKYNKAKENYLRSLKMLKVMGDKDGLVVNYSNMSKLHIALADTCESLKKEGCKDHLYTAIEFGHKAYDLAIEIGSIRGQNSASAGLKKAYSKLGQHKEAFKYSEIYIATKDSMFSEEKTNAMAEMTTKYEAENKQLQIEKMEKQKELDDKTIEAQQAKNRKQQIMIFSAITGLILVLVFSFFILRMLRQKRIANVLLSEQNDEINQQKEEIETQAKELEIKNTELEKLSIVASETDNAIVISSAEGNIEWVNDAFTKLHGYTLNEFRKQKGDDLIESSANPQIKKIIEKAISEKKPINYISHTITKSGSKIWVQTTLTPIIGVNGNISKIVAIDSDITEIKKAEKRINEQKEKIEEQNLNITDSIIYAQRIQRALLPPGDYMKKLLPHRFILYKPRDIVSGDFYWVSEKDNLIVTAAADCTGHGVPGAMMSMLGVSMLNEVVNTMEKPNAGQILNKLRSKLIESLHQGGKEAHIFDGINISLCLIDLKKKKVQFAGAYSPLYIISAGKLKEIAGDKMPIGPYARMEEFSNHNLKIQEGDMLYLFSDGYADQFGGENDKRFTQRRFRKLLIDIHNKPMPEQKEELEKTLNNWQGKSEQIDDILVMGVRI